MVTPVRVLCNSLDGRRAANLHVALLLLVLTYHTPGRHKGFRRKGFFS
jgi:hypothetical protein